MAEAVAKWKKTVCLYVTIFYLWSKLNKQCTERSRRSEKVKILNSNIDIEQRGDQLGSPWRFDNHVHLEY